MGYEEIVRSIAARVARRLPPTFEIDDLIQVGHLALMRAQAMRDPLLPEASYLAYLRRRVQGAMLDSIRGSPYREAMHASLDAAASTPAPAGDESLEERLDAARQVRQTWLLIDRLPPDLRRVMRMRYMAVGVEMMTQSQVAAHLGVSQMTVSNYERRAIAWVREHLAEPDARDERDKAA